MRGRPHQEELDRRPVGAVRHSGEPGWAHAALAPSLQGLCLYACACTCFNTLPWPAPQVSEGSGRLLVVAVGESSEWGKTMALMQDAGDDATPLQVGALGSHTAAAGLAPPARHQQLARPGRPSLSAVCSSALAPVTQR